MRFGHWKKFEDRKDESDVVARVINKISFLPSSSGEFRLCRSESRSVVRNVVTTSHLSPSRRSHNIHVRYVGTCERRRVGAEAGAGKRGREFVIVIARRGRAAIVITARHRSYRRVGLLRPVRIFRRIHSSSLHFAWPTRIFAPLHGLAKHFPRFRIFQQYGSISIDLDGFLPVSGQSFSGNFGSREGGEKGSSTRNRRDRSFWIRSRDREIGEFMAPFQRGIREYSD